MNRENEKPLEKFIKREEEEPEGEIEAEIQFPPESNFDRLIIKEEGWHHPKLGTFRIKSILIVKGKAFCDNCRREIKDSETAYLLRPSLKLICLDCCIPGNVDESVLIPKISFQRATPAFIKIK